MGASGKGAKDLAATDGFSENVGYVVLTANECELDCFRLYELSDEMQSEVHVLRSEAVLTYLTEGEVNCSSVVNENDGLWVVSAKHFLHQVLCPGHVFASISQGFVLGFSCGERNRWLLGGFPGDEMVAPKDEETRMGASCIRAVCPVSINERSERKIGLLHEGESFAGSRFEVTKDLQGGFVVRETWVL